MAQRIAGLAYAAYCAASHGDAAAEGLGWIGYDDARAGLPQARWLDARMRAAGQTASLRVSDAETALQAAAAGLGRTLLPRCIADGDPRLRRLGAVNVPVRDLWLLTHAPDNARAAVARARVWLIGLDWPRGAPAGSG